MGQKQNSFLGITAAVGLLVLIFDSSLALEGARSGVELCIKTVIPALFPFFVLSMMLTNSCSDPLPYPVQVLTRLLGIPASASSVLIPSFLGGYPVGAKCVGDLYNQKQISRPEAERLLSFCSNAGPSFLFGMVSGFFPERKMIWLLWFLHIGSALLTAFVFPHENLCNCDRKPEKKAGNQPLILSAATAMCAVCCWVILFRILLFFLKEWFLFLLPAWAQVFLMGFLELTNGCCELMVITDVKLRFVLCSCMLACGGICVLFQTISVTKGLSIQSYMKGKLVQTVFSFLGSIAIVSGKGYLFAILVLFSVLLFRKIQKRYGNLKSLPV